MLPQGNVQVSCHSDVAIFCASHRKDFAGDEFMAWGATIILSGRTTFMMAGGEESKAA
jgi:hypothetical protein